MLCYHIASVASGRGEEASLNSRQSVGHRWCLPWCRVPCLRQKMGDERNSDPSLELATLAVLPNTLPASLHWMS